jgi:hypothetical protein
MGHQKSEMKSVAYFKSLLEKYGYSAEAINAIMKWYE